MDERSGKRITFEKLTTSIVYEHLKSKKVVDNLYKDVLARIKETASYKRMKEVAVMHMTEILTDPSKTVPCPEDRVEKKKQIAEIGLLALSIDSSMSQIVSGSLRERAGSIINNALKDLMGNELIQCAEMVTKSPKSTVITRGDCTRHIPDYNETYNKPINAIRESDNESHVSNGSSSVSSVHTSDLSSFDDEIELSKKEGDSTIQEIQNFATELMLNNKSSNVCQEEGTDQQTEAPTSKSQSKRSKSVAPDDNSRRTLSKRIRKPNSKYASKDMLLLDAIHPRQKELLDVQRDLNIINGINAKLNKGEVSKSLINRKRKAD